ncbi:hypothetical protein [Nocardia sp. NPDC049149]|uniref:hypothetical protein n=1 Tax=Nocardia sp. NPDC049149 TaxID=3364315 RepID=UPI00371CF3FB
MLFSTPKSTTARRVLARAAVAGAIVVMPLTALAIPASADANLGIPGVTDVSDRPNHDRRNRDRPNHDRPNHHRPNHDRDCDDFLFRDWYCDDDNPFDHRYDDPFWRFRHDRPSGLFGSS